MIVIDKDMVVKYPKVKTAAEMMGLVSAELRLPLCRMPEELDAKLKGILKAYCLID